MSNAFPKPTGEIGRLIGQLRYQFSQRSDWKRNLKSSGLPTEIQELIFTIASRSKLMRFEKAEITDELIAHFEDGSNRGNSFESLSSNFGDPEVAAKLIRNSKIRNRPMLMKFGRVSAVTGLGGVAVYVGALIFFHAGRPNPQHDYLAELNAPIASIAEEDKAWNVYRDVWARYQFCEGPGGRFEEIYFRNPGQDDDWRYIRPTDEGWDAAIQKLADSKELLDNFRVGARLPALGVLLQSDLNKYSSEDRAALFPGSDPNETFDNSMGIDGMDEETDALMNGSMMLVLLPHVQSFRNVARILTVDTRWAIEQGDTERVIQNIEAIIGMSRQAAEPSFLVCGLVGIAVNGIAYDLIDEVLANHPDRFSDEQLARIQVAIQSISFREFIDLDSERLSIRDVIQRVYTDDGHGDGRMTPEGMELLNIFEALETLPTDDDSTGFFKGIFRTKVIGGPASLVYMASRKQMTEKLDELLDKVESRFDTPFWVGDSLDDVEYLLQEEPYKYRVLANLFPAYQQVRYSMERAIANQNGMIMAIAAHRHRQQFGEWPGSANDLIGTVLDEIPLDRVNGEPLNYQRTPEGFQIYSVGLDRDDDGGKGLTVNADGSIPVKSEGDRPMPAREFTFVSRQRDGDWIIWPRFVNN